MKIAPVQLNITWESKKENYVKAETFIKKASDNGCDIVVLPEMFNTGFSMNISAIAEDEDGETSSVLSQFSKKYDINLIAGYAVKSSRSGKGLNIAVVFNRKGEVIARYAKLHPFSYAKEDQYYDAGINTVVFNIDGMKASIFICYDLRFPEVFRGVADEVQAIFIVANWPSNRKYHWETLLKARAIENQCFVIGVNRTGIDGNSIEYAGASNIIDPYGKVICTGGDTEEFFYCDINPNDAIEARLTFPFLNDRHPFTLDLNGK